MDLDPPDNGMSFIAHGQPLSHAQPQPGSHIAVDNNPPPDRRPKKSSSTCAICRFRKVRCNGARPACSNCQRLGFPCSYDEADVDAWSMSLPRRRVKQACLSCHSRKARCSGHLPSCERCRAQGIECVYRPSKRAKIPHIGSGGGGKSPMSTDGDPEGDWSKDKDRTRDRERDDGHNDSSASTDPASAPSPSIINHEGPSLDESFDSTIGRTFDMFFRHVHHIPMYSFLHRASLMEQYHAGKVDRALLLALIGITSCLADMGPGMCQYGDRCIDDAEALLLADYSRPSTMKVQALVFIIKHRTLCNKFSNAFVLLSIASRFAAALRLNYDAPNLCFLAQESRRRLVWALYCIDSSMCGGYPDFIIWRADRIHVSLPCNERNFEFDLPQHTEKLLHDSHEPRLPHAEDVGSLALHIRILHIRQRITEFLKVAQVDRGMEAAELQGRILALDKELDDFANHLPTSFQFSENTLRLRAYSPRICAFVMIHVWWRQCHCDLYRLALAGIRGGLPQSTLDMFDPVFLEHCQRQCVDHALALTNIFSSMQKLNAKPVADLDLAMCAYQCARMLRYLYQVGFFNKFGLTGDAVLDHAKLCLKTIKDCCAGPAVSCIVTDLEKLISRGLRTDIPPMQADSPEGNKVSGIGTNHSISQQAILQSLQVTDDSDMLSASNPAPHPVSTTLQPFTPTPSSTLISTTSSFPHSAISAPWISENFSHDSLEHPAVPDVHAVHSKSGTPDLPSSRSEFTSSELNNAYEGALDGLGLDNGLDYAMGVDMNMWTSNGGSWIGSGFANTNWAGI